MIRRLIHLACAALLTGAVMAQDVSIRSDHPDEYVVVKGDTLWDISGRFLDKPWQWPAIWHANPQINNPHLIYPGDVISLVYIDGVPQLRLRRGDTVKLSPRVRAVDREAIKTVSFDSIAPFMRNVRVLTPSEFEGLPYIVANNDVRLTATYSDQTYARGLSAREGEEFIVARLSNIYDELGDPPEVRRINPRRYDWTVETNVWNRNKDLWNQTRPWNRKPKNPIGYELVEVSRVRVAQSGDISVLDVIRDRTEVRAGDYILPIDTRGYDETFYPRAMDSTPEDLRVLATSGQKGGVGLYQIVAINGGSRQGLEPGHVFSAYRINEVVPDRTGYRYGSFAEDAQIRLPDVYDGLVMVVRTFDDISYGMVMKGDRVVMEYDMLRHPEKEQM